MKTLLIISFAASLFSLGLLSSPARAYPCDAREYSTFSTWVALWMQTDEGDYEREDFITDEIFPDYYSATELADGGDYEGACDILVKLIQDNDIPLGR